MKEAFLTFEKKSGRGGKTECQHDPNQNVTTQRRTGQRNPDSRHHLDDGK